MTLTIRPYRPTELPAISELCWAYRDALIARSLDFPTFVEFCYAQTSYADLIADLPRIYARPSGDILVADLSGRIVGCAMYYPIGPDTCEIKRVFVRDAARGTGAGRALITGATKAAAVDGHARVVLDTIYTLKEAIALYQSLGFSPCAPFYDPDPEFATYLRFYHKVL